jgi:hypothetical protein
MVGSVFCIFGGFSSNSRLQKGIFRQSRMAQQSLRQTVVTVFRFRHRSPLADCHVAIEA